VLLLCEAFVRLGWEVSVISLLEPLAYREELASLQVPVISLALSKRSPNPFALIRLIAALRKLRPDVVHCHQVHANLAGRIARAFVPIPVLVCTAHSITEGPRWREWAYRVTDGLCDLTTNVCQAGVRRYIDNGAAPASKIRYVPNAIDTRKYVSQDVVRNTTRCRLGLGTDSFMWLAVGNLRLPKDYPTMLESFRVIAERHPEAHLLIAGTGPLDLALEEEVAQKRIPRVQFLGARTDIPALLCAADGFLMSSSWEGTPLALLEAAATALPVVATRVGGIAEVVDDGKSGLLVPAGNPMALAEACMAVMSATVAQRAAWGAAGRRIVEAAFSLEALTEQWQLLYTQIPQKERTRPLERGIA